MEGMHKQPRRSDVKEDGSGPGRRIEAVQHSYAHPMTVLMLVIYIIHHSAVLFHQGSIWLGSLQSGHALTLAAVMRLALLVHEVVSVRFNALLLKGALYGMDTVLGADMGLVGLAYLVPVFQNLIAINSLKPMPAQNLWGFHTLMMVVGVVGEFRPSHSLVQAVSCGTLLTLRTCLHGCYSGEACNIVTWGFLRSLLYQGAIMHTVGIMAWTTAYIALKKHEARKRAAVAEPKPMQAAGAGIKAAPAVGRGGTKGSKPKRDSKRPRAGAQGAMAGLLGNSDTVLPSSTTPTPSAPSATSATDGRPLSPLPLESLGIHVFRALGLGPLLRGFDEQVNALADRIDEAIIIRSVCLPFAAYSLTYVSLARVRFMNYDYGNVSCDVLIVWMAAWFMLGRDSVTFDMMKALHSVQDRLSASLSTLSKPRKQTVTELVDSVRQQIAGGDNRRVRSMGTDDVQMLELLGTGSFGQVYKGLWRGTIVAVKSMVLPGSASARRERMAIMEAAISSALSHPNILQTYSYSLHPMGSSMSETNASSPTQQQGAAAAVDLTGQQTHGSQRSGSGPQGSGFEVRLLLEYMDLGTLRDALDRHVFFHKAPLQGLDYCAVLDTAADIAKGMLHLHSLNIIHGDLKARNVLLKSSATDPRGFTAKISDFGLSHKMEAEETHLSMLFQGTPTHMAPEVLLHGTQSKAADVYAFGITLWEVFTAARAYQYVTPALLAHHVSEAHGRPHFPPGTPQDYVTLAECCWHPHASIRPSFVQIVAELTQLQAAVVTSVASNSHNLQVEDPIIESSSLDVKSNDTFEAAFGAVTSPVSSLFPGPPQPAAGAAAAAASAAASASAAAAAAAAPAAAAAHEGLRQRKGKQEQGGIGGSEKPPAPYRRQQQYAQQLQRLQPQGVQLQGDATVKSTGQPAVVLTAASASAAWHASE